MSSASPQLILQHLDLVIDLQPTRLGGVSVHPILQDAGVDAEDALPTWRFQALFLLSGFMMIFHIICISSVFAIFKVSRLDPSMNMTDDPERRGFREPSYHTVKSVQLITFTGTAMMSLGSFLRVPSSAPQLWQLSLMLALGASLDYFPIMSIATTCFDRHHSFGIGAGGLVMAPVLQVLLDRYGIPWSTAPPH
ncbi:hypothetical protein C8R44DRAFT_879450 [Mycena epipterygia]|nr:hypothetical protein C8R44DRAFT_879450 [Mycena epipterygia]